MCGIAPQFGYVAVDLRSVATKLGQLPGQLLVPRVLGQHWFHACFGLR